MTTLRQVYFAAMLVCFLLATASAQDSTTAQRSSLTITATAVDGRVRITAPSSVVQMRLEVYAPSGQKLFDQEIRGGNVFDWHLQNGQAQRLAPGDYVSVVTAKSVSGMITQKIGTVSVAEKSVSVQPADSPRLSVQQTQAIGPVEENSSWTIAARDELQTGTVIANDGTDGQMIRGRGALSFRIGDFFSGVDQEQMRLTEAGSLGIGTSEPKAKLDVAGTILAQRFLVARPKLADGNKLSTDSLAADAVDSVQPLVAGTGTQDRIAKWTDNAATLGDSVITETGGNVGIGTTTPGSKLVVSANSATLPPASGVARFADADGGQTAVFADAFNNNAIFNVRRANGTAAAPSALQANQLIGVIGASGYGASAYMGTRARVAFWASEMWTNTANGTYLTFNTTANGAATAGGTERVRIDSAGNVGIGTSNPQRLLQIGADTNALFTLEPSNGSPNAGFIRFGDGTGWQLHIGRNRSSSGGQLITGTTGVIMSIADNAASGIGGTVIFRGAVQLETLNGAGASAEPLCRNSLNLISQCSSSRRYKSEIKPFTAGLRLVNRLQPVSFNWKENQKPDIGLIAEDVAQVEPRLTFKNKDGEIEGVAYFQVTAVLIKAVQEQQAEIQQQRDQIRQQQTQLTQQQQQFEALKKVVCRSHTKALLCK